MSIKRYGLLFLFVASISVTISLFYVKSIAENHFSEEPFTWATIAGDESYLNDIQFTGSLTQLNDFVSDSYLFEAVGPNITYSNSLSLLQQYDSTSQPELDRLQFQHRSLFRATSHWNVAADEDDEFVAAIHEQYEPFKNAYELVVSKKDKGTGEESSFVIESAYSSEYSSSSDIAVKDGTLSFFTSHYIDQFDERSNEYESKQKLAFYVVDLNKEDTVHMNKIEDLLPENTPAMATVNNHFPNINKALIEVYDEEMDSSFLVYDMTTNTIAELEAAFEHDHYHTVETEDGFYLLTYDAVNLSLYKWNEQQEEELSLTSEMEIPFKEEGYVDQFYVDEQILYVLTNETPSSEFDDQNECYGLYAIDLETKETLYHGELNLWQDDASFRFEELKRV